MNSKPTSRPVILLSEIFAATDTISYGPFKMDNLGDPTFKKSQFSIHGFEIDLKPQEKKLMAALMARQGKYLTVKMYHEAQEKTRPSGLKNIQIGVSTIRKKIGEALDGKLPDADIDAIQQYFKPANLVRSKGEKGDYNKSDALRGAYRLIKPTLS